MKLYTKEMFLIAAEKCEVSMIDAKHIMQYIDEYVTPIELPTDEEIDNASLMISNDRVEFIKGAKWVIEQINNKVNENNNH